jgi:hypothetical protein
MRLAFALMSAALFVACKGDPVSWGDPVFGNSPLSPTDTVATVGIIDSSICEGSVRVASTPQFVYAAWWRVRPDSSAALIVARRAADGIWGLPVVADSSDNGVRGCGRPAPAISADSVSGYVHVAYFLEPAKGSGIFFAHSMDSAKTFHSPVPIVFGQNPGRVSVASHGDRVAVAYEDPNATEPLIGVALSRTMGHIFEIRQQATSDNGRARQPTIRVDADSLHLWWQEYSADPTVSATRPAYRAAWWR